MSISCQGSEGIDIQHRDLMHSGADVLEGVKYTLRTDLLFRKTEEE